MLTDIRNIEHGEVDGTSKHSHAVQAQLVPDYKKKLKMFFDDLQERFDGTKYGSNREAWFIGEEGTHGDYVFSGNKIPLESGYKSWIWDFGRELFKLTGRPLGKQKLVAFIPHYSPGSCCNVHQDNEPPMRDDWIVSVSTGCEVEFKFGPTKKSMLSTKLSDLSVFAMSRFLYHAVSKVDGYRWNITFRCWQTVDELKLPKKLSQRNKTCADCKTYTYSSPAELVAHLENTHAVATTKAALIPYGLGMCPFCEAYFFASRGWAQHVGQCKSVRPLAAHIKFPQPCRSWWTAEKTWFSGIATGVSKTCSSPAYDVIFEEGGLQVESDQFVVFTGANLDHESDIKVPAISSIIATPTISATITTASVSTSSVTSSTCSVSTSTVSASVTTSMATSVFSTISTSGSTTVSTSMHVPSTMSSAASSVAPSVIITPIAPSVIITPIVLDDDGDEKELEDGEVAPTPPTEAKTTDSLLPVWFTSKSCVPAEVPETESELKALLCELHKNAAQLRRLPPLRLWRGNQRRLWARCTRQFAPYFEAALKKNGSSADFMKLSLRLLELPSVILSSTLPSPKPLSKARASLPFKLRKAESLAFQDRLHEATKVLFSHGVTPPSEAVYQRLQDLHPKLKEEIPVLPAPDFQFRVKASKASQALYRNCAETWKSLDPFGWSTALLHLIRAYEPEEGRSFFDLAADFVSKLANCEVSDSVAFAFTCGSLIALNKDPEKVRQKRIEDGLKPRERPINQGTMFLKLAFDLALRSPEAKEAAKNLEPIQQGVGAERGMEKIAHTCAAYYKKGYAILKLDATNGFQEIKRSKMHRAVQRRCPSLLPLFQKYYMRPSIGFYNTGDSIKTVTIEEGCRMGCKLSSFGFALTTQDPYEELKVQIDRTSIIDEEDDVSFLKSATDDVIVVLKPDAKDKKVLFRRVRGVCGKLDHEAEKVGLSFVNDKAQLLLPPGWEVPTDRSLLPAHINVKSDDLANVECQGIEVVGSPVGSKLFCENFVSKSLKAMLEQNTNICSIHPQAASKLLLTCVSQAPGYLSQVCHPAVTKKAFTAFDKQFWKLWTSLIGGIGPESDQLRMCKTGESRAQHWAALPTRFGGAGLRCWSIVGEYSWFCSFAMCGTLEDEDFDNGRTFLKAECEEAHARALQVLGGKTYINHADLEVIPPENSDALYDMDLNYYKGFREDHKSAKLQHEFAEIVAQRHLRHQASPAQLSSPHITASEKIRTIQTKRDPTGSVLPQLFKANLCDHESRLTPSEFIISARQFIGLPALKLSRGEIVELKCGCEAQKCANANCGGALLDPAGNHALVCHAGMGARKATLLEKALDRTFKVSSGRAERQPPTHRLLGDLIPKEDLAALFPGGLTVDETKRNADLGLELVDALCMHPSARKDSVLEEIRSRLPEVEEAKEDAQNKTIRFDLRLAASFPADCPRELWLDHAIVQETATSYQDEVINELEAWKEVTQTLPFRRMTSSKQRRYAALVEVTKHMMKLKLLDFTPFFLFPVVSHLGYLNEDAVQVNKWMSTVLNDSLKKGFHRDDGIPFSVVKARYRKQVKNAWCFGLLRGNALAMNAAGRVYVNRPV